MISLKADKRNEDKKINELRAEGYSPAVLYGPKQKPIHLSIKSADLKKTYEEAGESTIVSVVVDGEDHDTLIHDLQFDPVKGDILHADFYAIERGKKLQVSVELVFEGMAPAEKNLGALIVKVMHEIEVECLPRNLPHNLAVSLESLTDLDSQVLAKDIKLPEGVALVTNPEDVILAVKEVREEEEEPVVEVDMDSIEVEHKGKAEEAEEGEEKAEKEDK